MYYSATVLTDIGKILNRPYTQQASLGKRWLMCLYFALFVFLFLFIFRPFGLGAVREGIFRASFGYGLTTFLVMAVLNIVFFTLFPRFFSEEKWTVGRELSWSCVNICLIGLANTVFTSYIGIGTFSMHNLFWYQVYTLGIGIFPVTISVLVKEARLNRKYEHNAAELNTNIHRPEASIAQASKEDRITLHSDSISDTLELNLADLLYIQSSDNYVEVYYLIDGKPSKKLLRNSLKRITEDVSKHARLFRCHKSYLVNLDHVKHVSGNAQGYKLHLPFITQLIPVSRSLNEEIKNRLAVAP